MSIKDWTQSMWDKIKARSPFTQDDTFNLANGGTSGYKPNTAKQRALRETQRQAAMNDMPQTEPMSTNMNWEQFQQPEQATAYNGFTGMQQPQTTSYQQPTGYQQTMGYQQPTGYQQTMGYQDPTAYQPTMGYQEQPQQGYMDPMGGYTMGQQQSHFGNTAQFPPQQTQYQFQQQYQPQQPVQQDNISYMPGNFVGEDGKAYSHCERVAVVPNVSMCYRIIEFMRNNESVIVSTEQITDEAENQRCLDLLYGAAFAMNCSFTRIAAKSIYLLAPANVMVVPYEAIRRMSDQDINARWPEQERESRYGRQESRFGARSQGYGRQQDGYTYGRRDYAQNDYMPYGGYQAVGYGR